MEYSPKELTLGEFGTFYASHDCYPDFIHGSDWEFGDHGLRKLRKGIALINDADPRIRVWTYRNGKDDQKIVINGVAYGNLDIEIRLTPQPRVYYKANRDDLARCREGLTDAARKWLADRFDDQLVAFARDAEPELRRNLLAHYCDKVRLQAITVIHNAEHILDSCVGEIDKIEDATDAAA
jgi:hypothetical protein